MSRVETLRKEYPGDEAWNRYVDVFRSAVRDAAIEERILETVNDDGIAIVLSVTLGDRAMGWLVRNMPALDASAPLEVMDSPHGGVSAIRTLLMRMPM